MQNMTPNMTNNTIQNIYTTHPKITPKLKIFNVRIEWKVIQGIVENKPTHRQHHPARVESLANTTL
jgi:hypothetical protein